MIAPKLLVFNAKVMNILVENCKYMYCGENVYVEMAKLLDGQADFVLIACPINVIHFIIVKVLVMMETFDC